MHHISRRSIARTDELNSSRPFGSSKDPEGIRARVKFAELGDHLIIVANLISASNGRVLKRGQRREQTAREGAGRETSDLLIFPA